MEVDYFKVDRDKVFFNYVEKFESGEDDCLNGEFDLSSYKKGIKKLNGNGNCEILGKNCSMKILNNGGLIEILFFEGNRSFFISGLNKKNLA
jgi:hypothetical protein